MIVFLPLGLGPLITLRASPFCPFRTQPFEGIAQGVAAPSADAHLRSRRLGNAQAGGAVREAHLAFLEDVFFLWSALPVGTRLLSASAVLPRMFSCALGLSRNKLTRVYLEHIPENALAGDHLALSRGWKKRVAWVRVTIAVALGCWLAALADGEVPV